jgi:hypothetical protein
MITIEDIISYSKPHPNQMEGARQTVLFDDLKIVSIVGGAKNLYGDFKEDFEMAIIDKSTGHFITKYFVDYATDDVLGYQNKEQVENLVNSIFKRGFQVK